MKPEIRYCTAADGTRIAYATGDDGPPLVVSPAWGSNLELMWDTSTYSVWRGLGRTVVSYDRRGIGSSQRDVDDFTIEAHVADLAAVVDAIGPSPCDLVGGFDSAGVTIAYAAQYPDRVSRLILSAAYSRGDEIGGPDNARGLVELAIGNWRLFRRAMADIVFPRGPTESQRWYANLLRDSMSRETAARYLEFQTTLDVSEFLPRVQAPTIVIFGRNERRTPASAAKEIAAKIPDCRLLSPESEQEARSAIRQFLGAPEPEPPEPAASGTAVILFADIVDSTVLTERLGDAAFRAKARDLDTALRAVIRDHSGTAIEGKLLGDGVLAVFTSAAHAIEAALACARAGDEGGLPLHLGIHAGDVIREADPDGRSNVYGGAVNIASRISALSAPGEVLVSDTVRSLARTSAGVSFEDRGEQSLKGIAEPVRVWAVESE